MIEWEAPAIVLTTDRYGESSLLAQVLTAEHGVWRGMARGGASRRQASIWETGNILVAQWKARLPDQLGHFKAEPVRMPAASLLDSPFSLALLSSACALAAEALPEKEPCPEVFTALVALLGALTRAPTEPPVADYLRWEVTLLRELGYGLDLTACAVTGVTENLAYVSPRTGRAVSAEGAGTWRDRLLPLPAFFLEPTLPGDESAWRDGFRLTGHFLQRAVFDALHKSLPAARDRLARRMETFPTSPINASDATMGESAGEFLDKKRTSVSKSPDS